MQTFNDILSANRKEAKELLSKLTDHVFCFYPCGEQYNEWPQVIIMHDMDENDISRLDIKGIRLKDNGEGFLFLCNLGDGLQWHDEFDLDIVELTENNVFVDLGFEINEMIRNLGELVRKA